MTGLKRQPGESSRAFLERCIAAERQAGPESPLNNLNYKPGSTGIMANPNDQARGDHGSSATCSNLNNLKPHEKRGGVPRRQLYEDAALSKAMQWGVEEWLVQVCIRDYGLDMVKRVINRVYTLPEGYFKSQYGPIPKQRGRIFNKEMQKLKAAKGA